MPTYGGGEKCCSCDKTVYPMDKRVALGKTWHKVCCKCTGCEKTLNPGSEREHDDKPYCANCYGKSFGPQGVGGHCTPGGSKVQPAAKPAAQTKPAAKSHASPSTTMSSPSSPPSSPHSSPPYSPPSSPPTTRSNSVTVPQSPSKGVASKFGGGGDKCHFCTKTVYHNERQQVSGKVFHKTCVKCHKCSKTITVGAQKDHENEIYCNTCFQTDFGTTGVGFGNPGMNSGKYQ